MNIDNLSHKALLDLKQQIDEAVVAKRAEALIQLRADIVQMLSEQGFTLQDILAPASDTKMGQVRFSRGKTYRLSSDPSKIWVCVAGRPAWVREAIAQGHTFVEVVA